MTTLPDGGKAWFVRVRTPTRLKFNPVSWEGWAVMLAVLAGIALVWVRVAMLRPRGLYVFAMIGAAGATVALVVLSILVAVRKSAPAIPEGEEVMSTRLVRDHFRVEPGYWFVPKLFGYGATPVTWQGWALTIGFSALLVLDVRLMPGTIAKVGVGVALLAVFLAIAARRTQGGWAWRWGSDR